MEGVEGGGEDYAGMTGTGEPGVGRCWKRLVCWMRCVMCGM